MKKNFTKIWTLILTILLVFSTTGCSSKNENSILQFFDAFDHTLKMDSGKIEGNFSTKAKVDSSFHFTIYLDQKNELRFASKIDLMANQNEKKDFLNFYIKDGKTYLNSMGTKSQSLAKNIGIKKGEKINVFNPFLSYTDEELINLFKKAEKKGDTYSFELNRATLSSLLDSYGSIQISKATMDATIHKNVIQSLTLQIRGNQKINNEKVDTEISLDLQVNDYNRKVKIPYPSDLESY